MTDKIYPVPAEWAERAFVNSISYKTLYEHSVKTSTTP